MERLFCENCNFHAKDNWDLRRHEATQRHQFVINGLLEIHQQCNHVFKDGRLCNKNCWGDKCKEHSSKTLEHRKKRYQIKKIKENKMDSAFEKMITDFKQEDFAANIPVFDDDYIKVDLIKLALDNSNYECFSCHCNISFNFKLDDDTKFTVYKRDKDLPYNADNCRFSCFGCSKIDDLEKNLNPWDM